MNLKKIIGTAFGLWLAAWVLLLVGMVAISQVANNRPCADGYHKWIDTVVHPGDRAGTTYQYCLKD